MERWQSLSLSGIFKRKSPERVAPLEKYLGSKPIRNPYLEWSKIKDGRVEIKVVFQKKGRLSRIIPSPDEKRIILDIPGSFVWEKCDGAHTVKDIIEEFSRKFKVMPLEAQISIFRFFQLLAKRKFIGALFEEEKEENTKTRK